MAEVVGRNSELELIESWLADPARGVLVLEGEAGVGKTTLWRAGIELARAEGYRVLSSSAAGSEAQISFTTLRDLLDEAFDEVSEALPPPQRRAVAVTLLREEPAGAPPEQGAIAVAFLNALRELAARTPVLVAVDDVQWLDAASAGPLEYAVRRLESEPVKVLVARRTGEITRALAASAFDHDRAEVVRLDALTIGALARILHDRLGSTFPRPTLARLHQATGGNPFFALVLARTLGPDASSLRPGEPLHVHASLPELVRTRFTALPRASADVLAVASALSRPTLDVLNAAVGGDPEPALAPAVEAELVDVDGRDVRFTHPLFAAEAYELAAPRRRREIHAVLADIALDPEERARHLALATTEPSDVAASLLEDAAHTAASRGAATAAAELAAEAYRLTPPEDVDARTLRALDAGWFQFIVGDAARARALLEEAEQLAPPGALRARARTRLGWLEHHAGDRRLAVERYRTALDDAEDERERAEIFSLLAWSYAITREDIAAAEIYARRAVELCDAGVDDAALLVDSLAVLAQAEFFLGGGLPSAAMERALSLPPSTDELRILRRPTNHWAFVLLCADRFDEARPLFEEVLGLARDLGDESAVPWPLMRLCHLELAAGNWERADRLVEEALDAAALTGLVPVFADLTCTAALVQAHLGRVDQARATAAKGLELADDSGSGIGPRLAEWALGALELVLGDAAAAAQRLGVLWAESKRVGLLDPGENRYLGELGEALVAVGDDEAAGRLAEELGELGRRLERQSAIGLALRIEGLAAGARSEHDLALALLHDAAAAHESAGLPFEHARTLFGLGTVERRARRRRNARETLERARAGFQELGAELWVARTEEELGRIGGRTPSSEVLTPTEARVAKLVAEGNSNKEVAATLVVSVHTVEAALTSIYRKLDVRSRTEMAAKLARRS
jgi:DNA-binding CsgD family transcriptional regulator